MSDEREMTTYQIAMELARSPLPVHGRARAIEKALTSAEERGRQAGLEEAAKVAETIWRDECGEKTAAAIRALSSGGKGGGG